MYIRLTRIEATGFRSLRDVVLRPRRLTVLVDPEGTATRDLVAFFTLLRELAHGQLQQTRVLDAVDSPVKLMLGVHDDDYTVELRRFPDGRWRIVHEELELLAGMSLPFVEPGSGAPCDEACISTFPPGPTLRMGDDEAAWLGEVADRTSRDMNGFLRGFRVQPAESFDAEVPFLFLEEPDVDLPANAVWDRVQSARAASSRVPVLLCTPSVALADAFDLEDVLRVETSGGTSSFRPLVDRKESGA
ncbi:hypothetical protein [Corallococcus carmarthensis]|uniref:Uncharacterized protein n=1 Tax=Corallococcus carmarthensis TaxID=2316728 RepID=A0A3A8K1F0_9BACT|nr:hypothetical protein [Corallococcus carmarthensis]RKG98284.1 hypothetical protein D7X32_30090 [Corallococcus carmarthensis]